MLPRAMAARALDATHAQHSRCRYRIRDLEATIAFFTDLGLTVSAVTRSAASGPIPPSASTEARPIANAPNP